MFRFTILSKNLFSLLKDRLVDYKEIHNPICPDEDFVLLDEENKEYIWFENGDVLPIEMLLRGYDKNGFDFDSMAEPITIKDVMNEHYELYLNTRLKNLFFKPN